QQLLVSYMQAALTCEFIERRFGTDKLLALLHAFVTTSDVSSALERSLGLSASEFDQRFHADLLQHYARLFTHIDAWRAARSAAERAAAGKDWGGAEKAAEQALALEPQDVEDDSPYLPLAQAYAARGQDARAIATLLDYWRRGGHDSEVLREL